MERCHYYLHAVLLSLCSHEDSRSDRTGRESCQKQSRLNAGLRMSTRTWHLPWYSRLLIAKDIDRIRHSISWKSNKRHSTYTNKNLTFFIETTLSSNFHLRLPNVKEHVCVSIGNFWRCIGQLAFMVSLKGKNIRCVTSGSRFKITRELGREHNF